MAKKPMPYQAPTLTRMGSFATLTLGLGHKGRDHSGLPRFRFHG